MNNKTKGENLADVILKNLRLTADDIVKNMTENKKVEYGGNFDNILVRMTIRDDHIVDLFIDDDKVSYVGGVTTGDAIRRMCKQKQLPEETCMKRQGVVAFTLYQFTNSAT